MAEPLQGLTLWLTRPGGASDFALRLQQLGARVVQAEAIRIDALEANDPALQASCSLLCSSPDYRHIIFISSNAVAHGLPLLDRHWPQWRSRGQAYAIGAATARLLAREGIDALQPEGVSMNSEALVALPLLQALQGDKVLIVRGVGGREWLLQALERRGAAVDYLEAYRRNKSGTLPENISRQIAEGAIDIVFAASGDTVERIIELVGVERQRNLQAITIVVPGQRVGRIARAAGFKRVIEAANAGDEAMLGALMEAIL